MLIYNQDIYKIIIIAKEYQKNHCVVVCYFLHRNRIVASLNKIIICVTLDFSIIMSITIDTFSVYSTMIYVIFLIKYILWTITKDFFLFFKGRVLEGSKF